MRLGGCVHVFESGVQLKSMHLLLVEKLCMCSLVATRKIMHVLLFGGVHLPWYSHHHKTRDILTKCVFFCAGGVSVVPGDQDLQGDESSSEDAEASRSLLGGGTDSEESRLKKKWRLGVQAEEDAKMRRFSSFVLAIALDLHALFAGFGLGAESSASAVEV